MRAAEIELLLPDVLRRGCRPGTPLAALLAIMEAFQAPAEQALAELPAVLDPLRTPDRFVAMLASWVDLDHARAAGVENGRLRLLIAAATPLAQQRGTLAGLTAFLRLATGVNDLEVTDTVTAPDGSVRAFHIAVLLPPDAAWCADLVADLLRQEKPAHLTGEVIIAESEEDTPTREIPAVTDIAAPPTQPSRSAS
jgi:phage tail-like protein